MPKTERMLKIMQRVYEKRSFTVGEMAEEFSVSYRTMLRYLHELSELGVPLYATEGKHGGYSVLTPGSGGSWPRPHLTRKLSNGW